MILEPVKPKIDEAIKPLTPTAILIPRINICGIAKPLFFFDMNFFS